MATEIKDPIWYLAGPFHRYEQDVKKLAKRAGVRIIDANVTASRVDAAPEKDLPKVTLKPEYRPVEAAAAGKPGRPPKDKQLSPEEATALAAELSGEQGGK